MFFLFYKEMKKKERKKDESLFYIVPFLLFWLLFLAGMARGELTITVVILWSLQSFQYANRSIYQEDNDWLISIYRY